MCSVGAKPQMLASTTTKRAGDGHSIQSRGTPRGRFGALLAMTPITTAGPPATCISGQDAAPGQHRGTCRGFLQNMPVPGATLP